MRGLLQSPPRLLQRGDIPESSLSSRETVGAFEEYLNLKTPVRAVVDLSRNLEAKTAQLEELKAKVAQIPSSKPALEALLKRVLELESKLSESKK